MSRKRLLDRMQDEDCSFVYIIGQPGSGRDSLLAEYVQQAEPASFALVRGWDCLSEEARQTFRLFLEKPPSGRRIVVTAETPLLAHPFVDMPPDAQCVIADSDLAFTLEEVRDTLQGVAHSSDFAEFVLNITGGHAGAVNFVRRTLRNDGESAARDLSASSYLALNEFVRTSMLSVLSKEEAGVLFTMLAIGSHADAAAVQVALPWANADSAIESLHKRRLLQEHAGQLRVVPFVESALRQTCAADIRRFARTTVADLRFRGQLSAAARAALNVGSIEEATNCLLQMSTTELLAVDATVEEIVSALPDALVTAEPRLWLAAVRRRRAMIDSYVLQQEAETLLDVVDDGADPDIGVALRACLGSIYSENGLEAKAEEIFQTVAPDESKLTYTTAEITAITLRAGSLIRYGRLHEGSVLLRRVTSAGITAAWLIKMTNILNIAHAGRNAHWVTEKTFHERQLELARSRHDRWWLGEMLLKYAYSAAINADRDTLERARGELRRLTEVESMGPYAAFASIAGRPVDVAIDRFGLPRMRAMAHVVEAYYAGSCEEAIVRLTAAAQELQETQFLPMRAVVNLALSQLIPGRRTELLDEAAVLAHDLSWSGLQNSISHLRLGELPEKGQPLRALVMHLRGLSDGGVSEQLTLNVIRGTVVAGKRSLNVSRRVFDLLVALAVRGRHVERDELCEMLWPDEDPQSATNALKMAVRRARLQCGDPNVVVWSNNKYTLGSHVSVDIKEMRAECELALKNPAELANLRHRLLQYFSTLSDGCPNHLSEYEWFVGTNATLQNLQLALGSLLARDALERNDFEQARALVSPLLNCDPCDELAWELVIRGHLACGDLGSARRAAEEYVAIARRSGCFISQDLVDLARREIA